MTLNFENALFLSARHYFNLQNIKISFEDVNFYAKLSLILDTPVGNLKTQQTILHNLHPTVVNRAIKKIIFDFFVANQRFWYD